nr:zinc knuckle CX2CX4HX4C [Tanacetum cinerariifolium]
MVFDDVMIAKGSMRWEKTLCAYFVRYGMSVNELRHNLRRMWSRCGFKDIVDYNNGIYFMKFNTDEGLELVYNNGPWMVKNKPLIVQNWNINMCLDKNEPSTIPLWIKICSVPLEAWTIKGISDLASRVGKPLVMYVVTVFMCKMGVGRVRFARVLVEIYANKMLPIEIEVVYKNGAKEEICRKTEHVVMSENGRKGEQKSTTETSTKKAWRVHGEIPSAMKRSANKYSVLELYDENDISELKEMKNKEVAKRFIDQKKVPTENDMQGWNMDMIAYYKGLGTSDKQREVRNFIADEFLSICAVLETHIKPKKLNKIGDSIFGSWYWYSNMQHCDKGEHSARKSSMTSDMNESKDCINNIEIEDVVNSGLFYTWTQNLFKAKPGNTTGVL